jgi:uncharacterized protein YecT (DUF1311 family)
MLFGMRKVTFVAILLAVLTAHLWGQLEDTDPQTKVKCEKYLQTSLPAEASLIAAPKAWPDCNSYKLYSGIGIKVDYAAARKCAWAERLAIQANLQPKYTVASIFGGSAMLSVLYANGEGVERNIPLAIRFSCEQGWAPAEFGGRVVHLESLRGKPAVSGSKFQFCDDITSGFMQGYCTAFDTEIQDQTRTRDIHLLSLSWPPQQQSLLNALAQAEQAYAHAHGSGEINISGTARAAEQIEEENKLRDEFQAALIFFEKGNLPKAFSDDLVKSDNELNLLYRKAVADAETRKSGYGAVQPEGIRATERAWLKYRDAWIAFTKMRYPSVSTEAWLTLLTNDRIAVLQDTLCEIGTRDEPCDDEVYEQGPSPSP